MALDPAVIALVGTLCGGVGLKLTEWLLTRGKTNVEDARAIREELRLQVTSQKAEIDQLEKEVDDWREKYFALLQDYMKIQTDLQIALEKIKRESEDAERRLREVDPG